MFGWVKHILPRHPSAGRRGERQAARHLRRRGYRVLGRNLRTRFGEVDLLVEAPDGRTVVIVEVKAGAAGPVRPEVHVNKTKQKRLASLATQLVRRHRLQRRPLRFDVIGVDLPPHGRPAVRHHVGAFEPPW